MAFRTKYRCEWTDDLSDDWQVDFQVESGEINVVYGFRYNWYAMRDSRNIANTGWHVPTESDWSDLSTELGGDSVAGGKLKETGLIHWNDPNTGATNEAGFNARGAGNRINDGTFAGLKSFEVWWIDKDFGEDEIYGRSLLYNSVLFHYSYGSPGTHKKHGCSIRLVKDSTELEDGESGTYTGNDGKIYDTICIGTKEWLAENLCETKYRNGDSIPEVTDNAAWAALTSGAFSAYDNDWDNAYQEPFEDLQASGEPLLVEWLGEDDILNSNIMGSKVILSIEAPEEFALTDLFTADNLSIKTIVYKNSALYWSGFVLANSYQEPYDAPPFTVSLVATDGVGLLKEFDFSELGYTTRQTKAKYIYDILSKVGITTFTEFVNLYESTMSDDTDDSPLDQSGVDPYLFEGKTLYDALDTILKSLNAGIRQSKGVIEIFRYKEVISNPMYGRIFTSATAKSATTKNPLQKIKRTGEASNFSDFEGGTMMIIPKVKKLTANQDYGFKESILRNHDFKYENFVYSPTTGWGLPGWVASDSSLIKPLSNVLKGQGDEGILLDDVKSYLDEYIFQTVTIQVDSSCEFLMQFEASGVMITDTTETGDVYVQIKNSGSGTSYFNGSAWIPGEININIINGEVFTKNLNWKKFSYYVSNIPYSGGLTVTLFAAVSTSSSARAAFKNVLLFFTDAGQAIKNIQYISTNDGEGIEEEREFILGDALGFENDPIQYKGAINMLSGGDPVKSSGSWHTRGVTQNKPIIELITEELAGLASDHRQVIDLPLRETASEASLDLNASLQDARNILSGKLKLFAISRATLYAKKRDWILTLIEIGFILSGQEGITVDSTTVTVDSTEITVDTT